MVSEQGPAIIGRDPSLTLHVVAQERLMIMWHMMCSMC